MRERKLDRRRLQADAVPRRDRLDARHAREHVGRRIGVPVLGARPRAGHQDAGVERRGEQDRDAACADAERQQRRQRRRVEQRVAAGQHEAVEVAVGRIALERRRLVDADADGARSCPRCAVSRARDRRRSSIGDSSPRRRSPRHFGGDVVDEDDVDAREPEPLQAVLDRAHGAVVGVVEHDVERQRRRERSRRRRGFDGRLAAGARPWSRARRHRADALRSASPRRCSDRPWP